jgi:hypothetical protein
MPVSKQINQMSLSPSHIDVGYLDKKNKNQQAGKQIKRTVLNT